MRSAKWVRVLDFKWWLLGMLVPVVVFLSLYPYYLLHNTFFWVCLLTLPLTVKSGGKRDKRVFFYLSLLVGMVSVVLPTTFGAFVMVACMVLFLIENIAVVHSPMVLMHLFLISPLYNYFGNLISVPLRLWLSQVVAQAMSFAGMSVAIDGNAVSYHDASFLIDEGCAGLQMMGYGLLMGTIVLSMCFRHRKLKLWQVSGFYVILMLLILIGNVVRITLLVMFRVMPENWLHETIGVIIYTFQIVLPFYGLVAYVAKHVEVIHTFNAPPNSAISFPLKQYVLLSVLLLAIFFRNERQLQLPKSFFSMPVEGFEATSVNNQVTKLENDQTLIYIKSPIPPYKADHNPKICWQGSGFKFSKISVMDVNHHKIHFAEMNKGDEKLYTAWWFESTDHQVYSQWVWRKMALCNDEAFYLINVTCESQGALQQSLQRFLVKQTLIKKNIEL